MSPMKAAPTSSLSREGGVNTVTMIYDGEEMSFSPMESRHADTGKL